MLIRGVCLLTDVLAIYVVDCVCVVYILQRRMSTTTAPALPLLVGGGARGSQKKSFDKVDESKEPI
jgi:hypothetical protein